MENNNNKPMGEKPMTAEEIQKAATIKFGACPIVEWDLPLHSRRQLIEFAAQQTQSLREENERLRAELDSLQKKHDLFCEVFDERAAKDNARMAEVNRLNARVNELEQALEGAIGWVQKHRNSRKFIYFPFVIGPSSICSGYADLQRYIQILNKK